MGDTHTVTVNDDRFQVIRHPAEGEEGSSLWLTLKSGETLDFEDDAGSTIMLTLTVTDSNGGSATTDVTIEVMNVNEKPMATGELPTVTGTAGEALAGDQTRIALGDFFEDLDEGDTLTYEATGGPGWLDFEVDEETGHGVLSGAPPPAGADAEASHTVTITATDGGGLSASRSFTLVVDDGNDPITGIEFTNAVGDKQITTDTVKVNLRTSVEENEKGAADGTLLGTFIARDADSPEHPNGMITWSLPRDEERFEIDAKSGELRLREGVELDFETTPFTAPIREIRLEVTATDGGDPKMSRKETLYIEVTDANDDPEANDTGISRGWWVTRDEELESGDDQSRDDYAGRGEWLTFGLETERGDDQRPAFTDPDGARTYTYTSISTDRGGDFLRIDPQTGVIQNRAGMVADEGMYTVTVQASDGSATADFTFWLAVAKARFDDDGELELEEESDSARDSGTDNDDPDIRVRGVNIDEDAAEGTPVATFTVEDRHLPIGPVHPWGRLDVHVTVDLTGNPVAQVGETPGPRDHFSVQHTDTTDDGTVHEYEVRLTEFGASMLDHEMDPEVALTVRAWDGTLGDGDDADDAITWVDVVPGSASADDGADYVTDTFDVDDVNEAPKYMSGGTHSSTLSGSNTPRSPVTFEVQQEQPDGPEGLVFLNLTKMIVDPDERDDVEKYGAVIAPGASSWLSFAPVRNNDLGTRTGPQKWEDIETAPDSGAVRIGNADVGWLNNPSDANDPDPDDIVLILRVDREPDDDGGSNAQDANGVLTVTATDDSGDSLSSTTSIVFAIQDENLDAPTLIETEEEVDDDVVVLSGPPREGNDLTATFDKLLDPDFTGTEALAENPILVRYQWFTFARMDGDGQGRGLEGDVLNRMDTPAQFTTPTMPSQETTENHKDMTGTAKYTVKQSDVGGKIEGRVIYYELFDGEIVRSPDADGGTDGDGFQGFASEQTSEVQNVPDEAKMAMAFSVETALVDITPDDGQDNPVDVLRITPSFLPGQERDRPVNADNEIKLNGYDFDYAWEYSPNGRTDWSVIRDLDEAAVDDDPNAANPTPKSLALPKSVEGGYVRLVVIYRDEGDLQDNQVEGRVNRVPSDPVKVGEGGIMHVDAETAAVTTATTDLHIDASGGTLLPGGVVPAGWTLEIGGLANPRGGRSEVEWEVGGTGGSPVRWTKVGDGTEYTVKAEDRGQLRAIVTRYDADDGLVSKTTVGLPMVDVDGTPTQVTLTPNMQPVFAQPGAHFVNLGKAPDADGKYMMLTGEIKLQSLFADPEGGPLASFSVSRPDVGFFSSTENRDDQIEFGRNTLDLWHDLGTNQGGEDEVPDRVATIAAAEGDQLLLINEKTGEVEYYSTQDQDHGGMVPNGIGTDGNGNWITVRVVGKDIGGRESPGMIPDTQIAAADPTGATAKAVNLRIDAAPEGFHVTRDIDPDKADVSSFDRVADDNTASTTVMAVPSEDVNIPADPSTSPTSPYFGLYRADPAEAGARHTHTLREHNSDDGEAVGMSRGEQTDARVVARIDVQDDNVPTHAYGRYTFTVDNDLFEVAPVSPRIGGDASQGILRLKTGQSLDFEALTKGKAYDEGDELPINLVVTATPADHPDGGEPHNAIRLSITVNVINVDEKTDPHDDDVPGLEDDESDGDTTGNDAGPNPPVPAESTDSGNEVKGDDTDTTDDTDADDDTDDDGDADDDHDGGWWEVATLDDGLF